MPPTLYETLELPPLADEAAVKSAYRKLARKYHPDLNPVNKRQAEERFKAINEAYNTLSNAAKKQAYDTTLRAMRTMADTTRVSPARQQKTTSSSPPPKTSASQHNSQPSPPPAAAKTNTPPPAKPESSTFEAANGAQPSLQDVFRAFWQPAGGAKPEVGKHPRDKAPSPKRGKDVESNVSITPEEAQTGCQETITVSLGPSCGRCAATGKLNGLVCPTCHGEAYLLKPTSVDIKLPAGVTHQARVRIAGQGLSGVFGGPPGDLFVLVNVQSKSANAAKAKEPAPQNQSGPTSEKTLALSNVEHRGLDVHAELSVSIPMGVLGGQVRVLTPSGVVQLSIPPLLSSGKTLKLKRQGLKQNGQTGDLLITLNLTSPEKLSAAEKKLYEALRDLSSE